MRLCQQDLCCRWFIPDYSSDKSGIFLMSIKVVKNQCQIFKGKFYGYTMVTNKLLSTWKAWWHIGMSHVTGSGNLSSSPGWGA